MILRDQIRAFHTLSRLLLLCIPSHTYISIRIIAVIEKQQVCVYYVFFLLACFGGPKTANGADKYTNTHTHTSHMSCYGYVGKQSLFKLGGKLKEFKNHLGCLADTISYQIYINFIVYIHMW